MTTATPQFPIVDALLLTPKESETGVIGICTNTSAPGQVYNEIEEKNRAFVSVLGPLIVSRDGTERMILNCLAHPTVQYLVLFSEESLTFSPSTNLLLALQHGFDDSKTGNYIKNGKAASAHFPNLSPQILDAFRENIIVLPLFMYKNEYSKEVILKYLAWLKSRIPQAVYDFLIETTDKKAIYYDTLNQLVEILGTLPQNKKEPVELDPKEFQHLQPPKIEISEKILKETVPYRVSQDHGYIRLDIRIENRTYFIRGKEEFPLEYSLMKFLGDRKSLFSPLAQLVLGAELTRVDTEIKNNITIPSFVVFEDITGTEEIPLQPVVSLVTDKQYYYKVSVREDAVSVMCLAFDVCESVFDLRGESLGGILVWLAEKNRFEPYEMDILHRIDVGGQIGRACIAYALGYAFIQDFASVFRVNKEELPLLIAEADSFMEVHKILLRKLYTQGLTEEHGDKQKGLARSAVIVAVYRDAATALESLPAFYKQGDQSTEEMRTNYKKQLLRFDHDGDYSYGERTRVHFGFDQLEKAGNILKSDPSKAAVIARYDPTVDMGSYINEIGKQKYTHDPCLVYDIFIPKGDKLHSLHIARAHNTVNAYPENIFGLHDAYVATTRKVLGLSSGDLYMLSSRGNILLLTEEQRTKKILGEPSKPSGDMDTISGPYELGDAIASPDERGVIAYTFRPLSQLSARPTHPMLDRLFSYNGVDTVQRAIEYYKKKGAVHNNPVLSEYYPGTSDAQGDQLVFFQGNVMGGKFHATAVFANRSLKKMKTDIDALNFLSSLFAKELTAPLGNLSLFYAAYTDEA